MKRKPVVPSLLVILVLAFLFPGDQLFSDGDPARFDDFGFRLHHHHVPAQAVPKRVGQDTLGAIQEVVGLLMEDPSTDWKEVSIARLREHLVAMDELMLRAEVNERAIENGFEIEVRGTGRTLEAIHRLVPPHARALKDFQDWQIKTQETPDGVKVVLTTQDDSAVDRLRALGFFGFMVSGVHHPHELLAIARGRSAHWPQSHASHSPENP